MKAGIDCKFFNGYKPCIFQKKDKSLLCDKACAHYTVSAWKILIIKRWAIGEVIRCTPIISALRQKYPHHEIRWMTDYPDIVNSQFVDKLLKFTRESVEIVKHIDFDLAINLDKEMICCDLINQVVSKQKKWYHHKDMKILPIDKDAEYLRERGINDIFMKKDTRHYIDEIFEVCGLPFNEEKYILPEYVVPDVVKNWLDISKKIIWLNTWTSWTWKTRLRKDEHWIGLATQLLDTWYEVIMLGWPDEDSKNKEIARLSWAKYFWTFDFKKFLWIVSLIDLMVTQVTFAMHVAVWLEKKTVLFNNIFNKYEYHFYDIPHIVLEPNVSCKMCYKSKYDSNCEVDNCMDLIDIPTVLSSIVKLLSYEK